MNIFWLCLKLKDGKGQEKKKLFPQPWESEGQKEKISEQGERIQKKGQKAVKKQV